MKRQKLAIEAKLNDCGGNLSVPWFVYYSVRNPLGERLERKKVYKGLRVPDENKRRENAQLLIDEINNRLRNGWNPLVKPLGSIYADQLEYSHIARQHESYRASRRTFNKFANLFLDRLRMQKRSPATFTTYKSKFRHFELYLKKHNLHENDISLITPQLFLEFITYMQDERGIGQNHTAEFTILFRSFGRWLIGKKELKESPFDEIRVSKQRGNASRSYNDAQIGKLREVLLEQEPQLWIAIKFIYYCFSRPKELRMLRLQDIDFERSRLTIAADIAKNNKTRIVDIPLYFLKELKDLGWHNLPGTYYIITRQGTPGRYPAGKNYLGRRFKRYHSLLGFSADQKFYGIKHTGVLNMIRSQVDWLDLKNQLGHHSLDQVMIYGQELLGTSSEQIRNVVKQI